MSNKIDNMKQALQMRPDPNSTAKMLIMMMQAIDAQNVTVLNQKYTMERDVTGKSPILGSYTTEGSLVGNESFNMPEHWGPTARSGHILALTPAAYTSGHQAFTSKAALNGNGIGNFWGYRASNPLHAPNNEILQGDVNSTFERNIASRDARKDVAKHPAYQAYDRYMQQQAAVLNEQQLNDTYGVQTPNPKPTSTNPGYNSPRPGGYAAPAA